MNKHHGLIALIIVALLLSGCTTSSLQSPPRKISSGITSPTLTKEHTSNHKVQTPPRQESVSIVMVGGILLHTPVEKSALQEEGTYQFESIFEHLSEDIQNADLALVNQEVIIGGEELGISGYPKFNAPYAIGDALVNAGFDVVCHATNHALDRGKEGLLNCLNF